MARTDAEEKVATVAVVGLNRFECMALSGILQDNGIAVDMILMPRFDPDVMTDLRLVTPDALADGLDHFLSHKETSIVYCDRQPASSPFAYVTPDMADKEIAEIFESAIRAASSDEDKGGRLSARETDVLRLIAKGLTIKEIGERLCISANTVATHRKNISTKLGIRTISGLSLYAAMNGIIND